MNTRAHWWLLALAMLALSQPAIAQEASSSHEGHEARVELFGGYSYLHEDGANLSGWTGTVIVNANHWFAVAADFDGHYGTKSTEEGEERLRVHGFTVGPHVSLHNHTGVTPFAFALFGAEHETVIREAISEGKTGFVMNLGGGLDVRLSELVSLRVVQVDAAYSHIDGIGKTSPRISTGLVFHLGRQK